MTTASGSYNNPLVVITPPNTSIKADDVKVGLFYVNTADNAVFSLNSPAGNFASNAIQVGADIHQRGQSTFDAPKPQYSIHLDDDPPGDAHFLDMKHGGKHWVFNDCGFFDHSLVRNAMAFHLQRKMGQWAPRSKFFELFIASDPNGTYDADSPDTYYQDVLKLVEADPGTYYQGIYLNLEKIRKESHRIDIPEYDSSTPAVGPIIMQVNWPNSRDPDKYEKMNAYNNLALTSNVYLYQPKSKYFTDDSNANQAQLEPIQHWYNVNGTSGWGGNFNTAYGDISGSRTIPDSLWTAIHDTTDYASFATYFLLNELARDPDGYHKSTFMYKTADTPASGTTAAVLGKCFGGPLWDKNKSFGNPYNQYAQDYKSPEGWLFTMLANGQSPCWWHVMIKDPVFCKEVWTQWTTYTQEGGPLNATYINAYVNGDDGLVNDLEATGAIARDLARYPLPNLPNGSSTTYGDQVDALTTYVTARLKWMGDNLADLLQTQSGYTATS